MNRNHYCCQRCGNLKYDWSGNLCPECLEKDRLRREGKKYFGMPIKMREATKEEKQGVDEYIQSISEKVYTKDEVIAMLTKLQQEILQKLDKLYEEGEIYTKSDMVANLKDIQAEIRRFMYDVNPNSSESDYACNYMIDVIQQKINALGCMESNS